MKSSVALLLFGLVVFVATTSARPNYSETDLSTFDENKELDHSTAQNRQHRRQRRRHSRQISDRYDNFSPRFYYDNRQLHDIRQQINELHDIFKNRQWQFGPAYGGNQPQQIYIQVVPYPVVPQPSCSCNKANNLPNLDNRLGGESNNNINTIEEDEEDEGRPISFKPVDSNTPSKPFPPVEHGSVQAGLTPISTTTAKPKKAPGVCEAAILLCCRFSKDVQKECFQRYGCVKTYSTGIACSPQAIGIVIQHFKEAYAPR